MTPNLTEMSTSAITVIVCSRDRAQQLARALPVVRSALGKDDRLVVVDSASGGPETVRVARGLGVECLRLNRPGLSRARNAGVRHATTEIVAFTDDDCEPEPDWLERVRWHFEDPAIAFVTGSVRSSRAAGVQASVIERAGTVRFTGLEDPHGMGHGANMVFRRAALLAAGLFDEQLGAGARFRSGEDADMLFRCLEAGWSGVYEAHAAVTHDQWRDARQAIYVRYGYGLGNGAFRMKVLRRDRCAGARLLLLSIWRQGVRHLWRSARGRQPHVILGALGLNLGMWVGLIGGALAPLDGANFRSERPRT